MAGLFQVNGVSLIGCFHGEVVRTLKEVNLKDFILFLFFSQFFILFHILGWRVCGACLREKIGCKRLRERNDSQQCGHWPESTGIQLQGETRCLQLHCDICQKITYRRRNLNVHIGTTS